MAKFWALAFGVALAASTVQGAKAKDRKRRQKRSKVGVNDDPTLHYGWSYYRYTQHMGREPHNQDKESAMLAGGDVKCDVCEVILTKVLQDLTTAKKLTGGPDDQEIIEWALEADVVDPEKIEKALNASRMEAYVEKYKKGCNRFFKENFMELGWDVVACHQQLPFDMLPQTPDGRIPWACARDVHKVPSKEHMNTYTVQRESIHYACEATITRHRDEIAKFLVENLEEYKKKPPKKLAAAACQAVAMCKDRKPSETMLARVKKMMGTVDSKHDELEKQINKIQKDIKKANKKDKKDKKAKSEKSSKSAKEDEVEL